MRKTKRSKPWSQVMIRRSASRIVRVEIQFNRAFVTISDSRQLVRFSETWLRFDTLVTAIYIALFLLLNPCPPFSGFAGFPPRQI